MLDELLRGRFSCRAYLPNQVPQATIEQLLRIAQRTPSWCNTQPWNVEITSGAATERFRAGLQEYFKAQGYDPKPDYPMPGEYTGVYLSRRRRSGWQLYDALGIVKGDREASAKQGMKNYELFGAPHLAIVTAASEQGVYGAVDTGLYVSTFLLAAQALGLGAIPQAAIARVAPFVREFFGIEPERQILLGISFGYADHEHPANSYRTERADIADVARFHTA